MPLKWKFQQNNDPKRRSKSVKNRFTQNRIDAMPWPAQSSDLSPIENLLGDIIQYVTNNSPTSKAQIWQVVQDALAKIPPKRCQDLVDSKPRRWWLTEAIQHINKKNC